MFGPILTEYEYDVVLDDAAKQALAAIVRHPQFDYKSNSYRRKFGQYRNGNLNDPIVNSITGYGHIPPYDNHAVPIEVVAQPPVYEPIDDTNGNGSNGNDQPVVPPENGTPTITDTRSATILVPSERSYAQSLSNPQSFEPDPNDVP